MIQAQGQLFNPLRAPTTAYIAVCAARGREICCQACQVKCKVGFYGNGTALMGTKLTKAPVCFTLAQMRFNPVLAMESFLPALQNDFREEGFPDYTSTEVRAIEVSNEDGGLEVREKPVKRFVFRNKAQTAAILLDPTALTYELSDYPVFEEFSKVFVRALDIVHQHRPIAYCDRIGMRMLDAVQPVDGETLDQYIVPQALGFIGAVDDSFEHEQTLTESHFKNGSHSLLIRAVRIPSGLAAPPDLTPLRLKLTKRFLLHHGETMMLDFDSSKSERVDFSASTTKAELSNLKLALSRSFKALVTEHALKVWE